MGQDHRTPSPRGFAAVHVAPDSSADVPDGQEARLLIVPQRQQAVERLERADRTLHDRLVGAYHWVLVPTQPDPTRLSNHLPPKDALWRLHWGTASRRSSAVLTPAHQIRVDDSFATFDGFRTLAGERGGQRCHSK